MDKNNSGEVSPVDPVIGHRSTEQERVVMFLPMPPSANAIWRSNRGRVHKSKEYKDWLKDAGWLIAKDRVSSVRGPVTVDIELCRSGRGDADNRIKPILDCLVANYIIDGDSKSVVRSVTAHWSTKTLTCARVTVASASDPQTAGQHVRNEGPIRG